eukprot:Rmarinus@m.19492
MASLTYMMTRSIFVLRCQTARTSGLRNPALLPCGITTSMSAARALRALATCTAATAAPPRFRYTKTHEYIKVDGNIGTVGITHVAARELGPLSYIEPPEVGTQLSLGEVCGSLESAKAQSDLFSPGSGEVVEVNKNIPEKIQLDPYGRGWIFKMRLSHPSEDKKKLLTAQAYVKAAAEEFGP